MIKHLKSIHFILNLVGLLSSLFIINFAICHLDKAAYIGVGVALLVGSVINFIEYFKKIKKQRKEESASAKLKFKGE